MVKNHPDATVPFRAVTHGAGQEIQVLGDLGRDLFQRQRTNPGRGQLNGQRKPGHQVADTGQVEILPLLDLEAEVDPACSLQEQLRGVKGSQVANMPFRGALQSLQGVDPFPPQVEPLARGNQNLDPGRRLQDSGEQRRPLKKMLKAIHHHQHLPLTQVGQEDDHGIGGAEQGDVQGLGKCRRDPLRCAHGAEGDIVHAVGKGGGLSRGNLSGQTRFSSAAQAGHRQKPAIGISQQPGSLGQFTVASHKGSGRCRQAGSRDLKGPCSDMLVQGLCLLSRLHAQLLGQDPFAGFVLRQGLRSLARARQQAHEQTMRSLPPRLKDQQTPGVEERDLNAVLGGIAFDQVLESPHRQQVQPLSLGQGPLFERWCAVDEKPFQELAFVQVYVRAQSLQVGDEIAGF